MLTDYLQSEAATEGGNIVSKVQVYLKICNYTTDVNNKCDA